MRPHRRQPIRLPRPWDSPGKNIGAGCHFLLQCMKVKSESEVAQSCLTLHDPMDCSTPGSSVHGIFQARVLEWGASVAYIYSQVDTSEGPLQSLLPPKQPFSLSWADVPTSIIRNSLFWVFSLCSLLKLKFLLERKCTRSYENCILVCFYLLSLIFGGR